MKYLVNIMYHGCIQHEVEAENPNEAYNLACEMNENLSNDDFVAKAEFMQEDYEVIAQTKKVAEIA